MREPPIPEGAESCGDETPRIRTMLEDRTLQAELDLYAEYARKVRFPLVPGLW